MNGQAKLFYVIILICFLPAYTQVQDTPVNVVARLDTGRIKEIEKIKRSVVIDLWLVKLRIGKLIKADSIKNVQDSIIAKDN